MSASELKGLILGKTTPLLGSDTKAMLRTILQAAGDETILQLRSMPVEPNTSPLIVQEQSENIKNEMLAEAIMSFLNSIQDSMVGAASEAIVEYLNAHSFGNMVPLSLTAPNGPVTAKDPVVKIQY